jgi:hypothetical protein
MFNISGYPLNRTKFDLNFNYIKSIIILYKSQEEFLENDKDKNQSPLSPRLALKGALMRKIKSKQKIRGCFTPDF